MGGLLVVGAGALLVLDLVLLPWHRYDVDVSAADLGIDLPSFRLDRTGVQSPDAALGLAAALLAAAAVALVVLHGVRRPPQAELVAGSVALGLLMAKLFSDTAFLGIGAYAGVALGAALCLGGLLLARERGAR